MIELRNCNYDREDNMGGGMRKKKITKEVWEWGDKLVGKWQEICDGGGGGGGII